MRRFSEGRPSHFAEAPGREDQRVGEEGALGGLDAERALREVDARGVLEEHAGAEALRLALEALHHLGPGDALGEARVVLDLGREHELAAELEPREHHRRELGARGVDRRGVAGRARSRRSAAAPARRRARGARPAAAPGSSSASSSPARSSAARSSKPPTWRSPIQICGTVRAARALGPSRRAAPAPPRCRSRSRSAPSPASSRLARSQYGHQDFVYIVIAGIGRRSSGPGEGTPPERRRPERSHRLGDRELFPEQLEEGADEEGEEAHQQDGGRVRREGLDAEDPGQDPTNGSRWPRSASTVTSPTTCSRKASAPVARRHERARAGSSRRGRRPRTGAGRAGTRRRRGGTRRSESPSLRCTST